MTLKTLWLIINKNIITRKGVNYVIQEEKELVASKEIKDEPNNNSETVTTSVKTRKAPSSTVQATDNGKKVVATKSKSTGSDATTLQDIKPAEKNTPDKPKTAKKKSAIASQKDKASPKIDLKTGTVKTTKKSSVSTKASSVAKKTVTKIDPKTGTVKVVSKKPVPVTTKKAPVKVAPQKEGSKQPENIAPSDIQGKTKQSKVKTIEPAPRSTTPAAVIRPTPKKIKVLNKEEKALYKSLQEAFNFVTNLTWVIEERTMDTKNIPDLTLGELHVIEMVSRYNNKPMTLIAKKLKVTVGAFTIGVNRLVQKEYLLRTRDEMDHRVILLSVTPKGKKVLKFHDKFHDDILGLALEGVSLPQATKVMTQFATVLEYYYNPAALKEPKEKKKK